MTLTALLLDLGDTLVHENHLIEHVSDALAQLTTLKNVDGRKIELALVSDYTMSSDPGTVERLFDEYVDVVRGLGLLPFFDPPSRRITLSTQAGVRKPHPAIFRLALARLGLEPDLQAAMFVTEQGDHVHAARGLGMTCWQYGSDFVDWSRFPALVDAALVAERPLAGNPQEAAFQRALEETGAVSRTDDLGPGQTHAVVDGPAGPTVRRKRFSID